MKIVIDIPDGCYEELNNGQFPVQDAYRLVAWIKDGTPLPKAENKKRLTNAEWKDFLSEQFEISRTSAAEMLHGMMRWKGEDNFKKLFNPRRKQNELPGEVRAEKST